MGVHDSLVILTPGLDTQQKSLKRDGFEVKLFAGGKRDHVKVQEGLVVAPD